MLPEYEELVAYFNRMCDQKCYSKEESDCPYFDICRTDFDGDTTEKTLAFEVAVLNKYNRIYCRKVKPLEIYPCVICKKKTMVGRRSEYNNHFQGRCLICNTSRMG